jgi:hypothetical protein
MCVPTTWSTLIFQKISILQILKPDTR